MAFKDDETRKAYFRAYNKGWYQRHRENKNKEEKSFTISYIAGRGVASIGTILKEIEKCEVLCGNCHAKRHWREIHEFDSWEEILGPE